MRRVGLVQVVLGRRAVHAEDLRAAGHGGGDQALVAGIGVDERHAAGLQVVDADVARQRGHVEALERMQVDQTLDAALGVDRLAHVGVRRREVQRARALGRPEDGVDDVGVAVGDAAQRVRPLHRLEVDANAGLPRPRRPFVGHEAGRVAVLVAEQVGRIVVGAHHAQHLRRRGGRAAGGDGCRCRIGQRAGGLRRGRGEHAGQAQGEHRRRGPGGAGGSPDGSGMACQNASPTAGSRLPACTHRRRCEAPRWPRSAGSCGARRARSGAWAPAPRTGCR